MKILVINGSPRGKIGNTQVLVDAFLAGAAESGAQSETVYLKEQKIEHCVGCFNCWTKTPGVCVFNDDMPALLEKVKQADIVVYATPLYTYSVTGLMKDFMDRTIPLAQPFINVSDGLSGHPRRDESEEKCIVLISNSGFPEQAHFSGLKETVRCCFRDSKRALAGTICCAGGPLLTTPGLSDTLAWYTDAVKQAAREVIAQKQISAETQAILEKPLIEDQNLYAEMANEHWKSVIVDPNKAPAEASDFRGEPLAAPAGMETVRDLVAGMATVFNPKAAGDLKAIIQFMVRDENPGNYYLDIADGKCAAYAGKHPAPSVTIMTPVKVWVDISTGKLHGSTAYMTGKYKASGDLTILMKLGKMFPPKV